MDEIRARVNMPALPAGLSKDEMILRVHNERRVELAWEEVRYFDLRRWQKPEGNLNATCQWLTGMRITKIMMARSIINDIIYLQIHVVDIRIEIYYCHYHWTKCPVWSQQRESPGKIRDGNILYNLKRI